MRVFVTGATGFVGSAVVRELIGAGHSVLGLARSDESAAALAEAGAEAHRGDLDDPDGLRAAASASDGVIHCAFIHDFSRYQDAGATDLRAVEAMGDALAGSDRPLVVTSGTAVLAPGRLGTEEDPPTPDAAGSARVASELATHALASRGVRAVVMRLPPSVHGDGDRHGFVPMLVRTAREKGVSAYVGDGANRWPAVHRLDAARLYRLAVERAAAGTTLHAVGDEGVPTREIAEAIGRRLGVPVVSKTREEAAEHFGWLGAFFGIDIPASSALTRERLDWTPTGPGLRDDLAGPVYFGS